MVKSWWVMAMWLLLLATSGASAVEVVELSPAQLQEAVTAGQLVGDDPSKPVVFGSRAGQMEQVEGWYRPKAGEEAVPFRVLLDTLSASKLPFLLHDHNIAFNTQKISPSGTVTLLTFVPLLTLIALVGLVIYIARLFTSPRRH